MPKKGKMVDVKFDNSDAWYQAEVSEVESDPNDVLKGVVKFIVSFIKGNGEER